MHETSLRLRVATMFSFSLLCSGTVLASDWKPVFSSDDSNGNETDWFIDLSSITKDGDLRRVTEKTTFEPFAQKDFGQNSKKWERKWISVKTYDCKRPSDRSEVSVWPRPLAITGGV
jgi:hypothetical protein